MHVYTSASSNFCPNIFQQLSRVHNIPHGVEPVSTQMYTAKFRKGIQVCFVLESRGAAGAARCPRIAALRHGLGAAGRGAPSTKAGSKNITFFFGSGGSTVRLREGPQPAASLKITGLAAAPVPPATSLVAVWLVAGWRFPSQPSAAASPE